MANMNKDDGTDHPTTKSSMSVSDKVVCEGEACIGSVDASVAPSQMEAKRQGKKQSGASSMAVGGEEICSDDACIGKG